MVPISVSSSFFFVDLDVDVLGVSSVEVGGFEDFFGDMVSDRSL